MVLLIFPTKRKRKRARRPVCGPAARVQPFPSGRHRKIVTNVCALMRNAVDPSTPFMSTAGIDAAEAVLLRHVELVWDRLEKLGVPEDERLREIEAFADAAWGAYQRAVIFSALSPGDAA